MKTVNIADQLSLNKVLVKVYYENSYCSEWETETRLWMRQNIALTSFLLLLFLLKSCCCVRQIHYSVLLRWCLGLPVQSKVTCFTAMSNQF